MDFFTFLNEILDANESDEIPEKSKNKKKDKHEGLWTRVVSIEEIDVDKL